MFLFMLKHSEHLCRQFYFIKPVKVVQCSLCSPAYIHCGCNISVGKFKNFFQLLPIINFFKFKKLYRSTGNNHTVILFMLNFVNTLIKVFHVALQNIFGFMSSCVNELHIYLYGAVRKQPDKLCFRIYFGGHQVDECNFQGPYILGFSSFTAHYKNIFFFHCFVSR